MGNYIRNRYRFVDHINIKIRFIKFKHFYLKRNYIMKTIQKLTLALLTVAATSTLSAAVLELDTAAGDATMAGVITGAAKKIGANQLTISNTISGALEVAAGSVLISANANMPGGGLTMSGGNLNAGTAITTIPAVVVNENTTFTFAAAALGDDIAIGAISGGVDKLLNLDAGTGAAPDVSMLGTAYLGNCNEMNSLSAVNAHLGASSTLPATASFSGVLDINTGFSAAASSAVTVGAAGQIDANINVASGAFSSLTARKIVFGSGVAFSQAVTVA